MSTMFEMLMELPLFKGVSHSRLAQVVGEAKFHFLKFPKGATIIRPHDPCTHLTFVISGSVRSVIYNNNERFSVGQTLLAPAVVTPEFLFGRTTEYPCSVTALESTSVLQISKADYIKILYSDEVFLFNYLNTLSMNAQKALEGILSLTTGEIDERIAFWIIALTQRGGKDIKLICRKRDLCSLFGVQRSTFDSGLENMHERGLLDYSNTELHIHSREAMLQLLMKNYE